MAEEKPEDENMIDTTKKVPKGMNKKKYQLEEGY